MVFEILLRSGEVKSIEELQELFKSQKLAGYVYVYTWIPILPGAPWFPFAMVATDNKFDNLWVFERWRVIHEGCKLYGLNLAGHISDGDSRLRKNDFRINNATNAAKQSWYSSHFFLKHNLLMLSVPTTIEGFSTEPALADRTLPGDYGSSCSRRRKSGRSAQDCASASPTSTACARGWRIASQGATRWNQSRRRPSSSHDALAPARRDDTWVDAPSELLDARDLPRHRHVLHHAAASRTRSTSASRSPTCLGGQSEGLLPAPVQALPAHRHIRFGRRRGRQRAR
mmetsp:Transcript_47432/g.124988  ORF Transcript_47432/g.124988 Transcript_47432/m.124988 type:complete len:285 (-) Transcript_47432:325-1179(-)